ncbi:uncharacterized protein LOC127736430 [Mytilus californianus]|uniref:uncharacterized protein LOC127736430 n=1 Tax=Mytilus californianus TaxID=6549 RepID=UPI002245777B|nr:uncharacterized protein LOC127736430 [Mytilus californianus]
MIQDELQLKTQENDEITASPSICNNTCIKSPMKVSREPTSVIATSTTKPKPIPKPRKLKQNQKSFEPEDAILPKLSELRARELKLRKAEEQLKIKEKSLNEIQNDRILLESRCKQLEIGFCENTDEYIVRIIELHTWRCIPISNCPPGYTIEPCKFEYTADKCRLCTEGLVQPDYIQSTIDQNLTKCFKNQNVDKCRADVLKPSRENSEKVCRGVEFCKCNTDKCFFGDPCACQYCECDMDETMLTNGTCVKCPAETSKIKCGCGPCFPSEVPVERYIILYKYLKKNRNIMFHCSIIFNNNSGSTK